MHIQIPENKFRYTSHIDIELDLLTEICRGECQSVFQKYATPKMVFPYLAGFCIPPFQRPLKWADEQKISFMESLFQGFDTGYIMYVSIHNSKWDGCLIDGQQRMSAIDSFAHNKISVFGKYYYDDFNTEENIGLLRRASIKGKRITRGNVTKNDLHGVYNRLNFSGTAHEEHERAK